MKAYIILGTTGPGIHALKFELERIVKSSIALTTTDKKNSSATTFAFEVPTPKDAKTRIDAAFAYLQKQPWYFNDSKLSFTVSGLQGEDGSEWYCDDCGEAVDECECIRKRGNSANGKFK